MFEAARRREDIILSSWRPSSKMSSKSWLIVKWMMSFMMLVNWSQGKKQLSKASWLFTIRFMICSWSVMIIMNANVSWTSSRPNWRSLMMPKGVHDAIRRLMSMSKARWVGQHWWMLLEGLMNPTQFPYDRNPFFNDDLTMILIEIIHDTWGWEARKYRELYGTYGARNKSEGPEPEG